MASRTSSRPPFARRRGHMRLAAGLAGGVLLLPALGVAAEAAGPVAAVVQPVPRPVTIDDAMTADGVGMFAYSDHWFESALPEAGEGRVHATDVAGATWSVQFDGDAVAVTAPVGPLQGTVEYAVDGGEGVVIDHYAPEIAVATVWTSPVVGPGAHVLTATVRVAGGEPRRTVAVDAVTVYRTGAEPGTELVPVAPAPVTYSGGSYTIPAVDGLEYVVGGAVVAPGAYPLTGRILVSAQALDGHVLTPMVRSRWLLLPPPTENVHVSDLEWVSERNGLGPVERDTAVGGLAAGDGGVLTLDGVTYAKGLGAHADSAVRVYLGGQCSAFRSTVGIDDSQGAGGSVAFAVMADGETLLTTPVLTGASAGYLVDVDVTGADYLDLVVDAVDDEVGDHADWARARVVCGDTLVRGILEPTVADAPGTGADSVTIPSVEGVEYLIDGVVAPAGENVVTAAVIIVSIRALEGYQIDPDRAGPRWSFAFDVEEPTTGEPDPDPTDDPTDSPTGGATDDASGGPTDGQAGGQAGGSTDDATTPAGGPGGSGAVGPAGGADGLARTGAGTGAGPVAALTMVLAGALASMAARRGARRADAV
ncbi:NPCBM/NEW2 domain-containing protein [Georgenia sp. MJ206]|uniref:NPCBM/NEW2 domain-containing protein n=1 Tax=Georgenia wangjunii TaxID=3117730 RepID=UPI002F26D62F